jgi:4-amino-4-deoxy-L-arabinose transferase-like glycosyltransferase
MTDWYWLTQTLSALPFAIWIYLILGMAWALVILPRSEWHQQATVVALSILLGGAVSSAVMLALGVVGAQTQESLLVTSWVQGLILVLTIMGWLLVFWKWRKTSAEDNTNTPRRWYWDERLLVLLIILAVIVRGVVIAYWPFTAYDALWVYGSQPRLYFLTGIIPNSIDYYPQFLQLQYLFMQLGVGAIDDHAARVVVWFLHVGSLLAVYALGNRLFGRRVGIYAMAIWALYPHVSQWGYVGDLEIPLAYSFTLSSLFFLQAWQTNDNNKRRQWAIIAGTVFGIAMWTKPTAGAFIWGVVILVITDLVRVRFRWREHSPRFSVAFWTGLACIPLGSIWYIRNILLGHDAVRFPHPSWLERATRSGDMFGWILLAVVLLLVYLFTTQKKRPHIGLSLGGVVLIALGIAPSLPWLNPARLNPPESYIQAGEGALLLAGTLLIVLALWRYRQPEKQFPSDVRLLLWGYLLVMPYFLTWFYSYSYHARLSFAIVPILLLPSAVIVARWTASFIQHKRRVSHFAYGVAIVGLALPGALGTYFAPSVETDWLWTDRYSSDYERYQVQNPGLALLSAYLSGYERETGEDVRVMAAGEQRLPFFFPLREITTDVVPTTLAELEGYTHFVYGSHARWRYEDDCIAPQETQIVGSLGRVEIFEPYFVFGDGTFRYELYELRVEERFDLDAVNMGNVADEDVVFGDWARYLGHSVSTTEFSRGFTVYTEWAFEALTPANESYVMLLEIVDPNSQDVLTSWQLQPLPHAHGSYDTRLWEKGEVVIWRGRIDYPADLPDPPCGNYDFVISFGYDSEQGFERIPVSIDGETTTRYRMEEDFRWSPCSN